MKEIKRVPVFLKHSVEHARLLEWRSVRFIGLLMTVIYIYCVNCMKFGQLILRKVIQIVATRCHILRLKMRQIRFRLGLRSRPRWGSLQRSPRSPSWI